MATNFLNIYRIMATDLSGKVARPSHMIAQDTSQSRASHNKINVMAVHKKSRIKLDKCYSNTHLLFTYRLQTTDLNHAQNVIPYQCCEYYNNIITK